MLTLQLSAAASKHLSTHSFLRNLTNAVPIQYPTFATKTCIINFSCQYSYQVGGGAVGISYKHYCHLVTIVKSFVA